MAKLIYVTNVSLDGYIEDEGGAFDLFTPDDDVFASTTEVRTLAAQVVYNHDPGRGANRQHPVDRQWATPARYTSRTRANIDLLDRRRDSETASYFSATALWDSDRQACPVRRPLIERPVLYPDAG